jgi:hypothetical protein
VTSGPRGSPLLVLLAAVAGLAGACTQQAAAVPDDAVRVRITPTRTPGPGEPTARPTRAPLAAPEGWAETFCRVRTVQEQLALDWSEMSVMVRIDISPQFKRRLRSFGTEAEQAVQDIRRLPPWPAADELVDMFRDVVIHARDMSRHYLRYLSDRKGRDLQAGAMAERRYLRAQVDLAFAIGDLLPKLRVTCP